MTKRTPLGLRPIRKRMTPHQQVLRAERLAVRAGERVRDRGEPIMEDETFQRAVRAIVSTSRRVRQRAKQPWEASRG